MVYNSYCLLLIKPSYYVLTYHVLYVRQYLTYLLTYLILTYLLKGDEDSMLEEADVDETGALALCFSARDVGARLRVYRPRYADWIIATVVGFKRDASEALSQRALNARDTPYVLVCFCFLRRDTLPSHVLTTPHRIFLSLGVEHQALQ